jgi:hypothetical protein
MNLHRGKEWASAHGKRIEFEMPAKPIHPKQLLAAIEALGEQKEHAEDAVEGRLSAHIA